MILVLQNCPHDGPAFLGTWLNAQGLPWRCVEVWREAVPTQAQGVRGVAVLGGPMSANDPLPGLRATEALIRSAQTADVPVLGHCLGGQLIARALGAQVRRNRVPEIGWLPVRFMGGAPSAWHGLGEAREAVVYQWHHDTFDLPVGAVALAGSAACPHQAFALGACLAMQFHIEVDAAKLAHWRRQDAAALTQWSTLATVQDAQTQARLEPQVLGASQAMAAALYARWVARMPVAAAR